MLKYKNAVMKPGLLPIALCLLSLPCCVQHADAQSAGGKNSFSISLGTSVPVGSFSSTDPSNREAGYAKLGEMANLTYTYTFYKGLGLTAMLMGQRNGLNTDALGRQLTDAGIYFGFSGSSPNHYPGWKFDKKSWWTESAMLGLTREWTLAPKSGWTFTARALAGLAHAQMPSLNGSSSTDTSYATVTRNGASAYGLSYTAGIGMRYKLNRKCFLGLNADYFGTSALNFKNIIETAAATSGGLNVPGVYSLSNSRGIVQAVSYGTANNKQPLGAVHVNLGIGINW